MSGGLQGVATLCLIVLGMVAVFIVDQMRRLRLKKEDTNMRETEIELGDIVRCRLTNFTGIAVVRAEWLHGCVRIGVQPQALDQKGGMIEPCHFDEPQLEVVTKRAFQPRTLVMERGNARSAALSPGGPPREGKHFSR